MVCLYWDPSKLPPIASAQFGRCQIFFALAASWLVWSLWDVLETQADEKNSNGIFSSHFTSRHWFSWRDVIGRAKRSFVSVSRFVTCQNLIQKLLLCNVEICGDICFWSLCLHTYEKKTVVIMQSACTVTDTNRMEFSFLDNLEQWLPTLKLRTTSCVPINAKGYQFDKNLRIKCNAQFSFALRTYSSMWRHWSC